MKYNFKIWKIACEMAVKLLSKQSLGTKPSLGSVTRVIVINVVIGGFSR